MNRSICPIGLLGDINFASVFHVKSPQQTYLNRPNVSSKLTLFALSVGSSGCGSLSRANWFVRRLFGITSPLAVQDFHFSGVFPGFDGNVSPGLTSFDRFCGADR